MLLYGSLNTDPSPLIFPEGRAVCTQATLENFSLFKGALETRLTENEKKYEQRILRRSFFSRHRKYVGLQSLRNIIIFREINLGSVLYKVLYGETPLRGPTPYPFIYHIWQKKVPIIFVYFPLTNGYPFHIPSLEFLHQLLK